MIPQKLVDFVHGPELMFLGTRSVELRPAFSWVFGAVADGERGTMTILVPEIEGAQSLRNLEDNGQVALTVVDAISHETYQFKGTCTEVRPSGERERAIQSIHKEKLGAHLAPLGFGPELWEGFVVDPSTAVTFEVEDIFVQTPGPGAGERIDMAETAPGEG